MASLLMNCARMILFGRGERGRLLDAVSRFHLSNGSSVYRLNFLASNTVESLGIMINYRYDLSTSSRLNDEFRAGRVTVGSSQVASLLFEDRPTDDTGSSDPGCGSGKGRVLKEGGRSTVADLQLSRALVFGANIPVAANHATKGTTILRRDDRPKEWANECYFVVSGAVQVTLDLGNGTSTEIDVLHSGAVFGWGALAALLGVPLSSEDRRVITRLAFVAAEECHLILVPQVSDGSKRR